MMSDKKVITASELEELIKEMARQHPGQADKHIPQIQPNHIDKKVSIPRNAPQKKMRKGTQKGR